eukprot:58073-Chlamydomonas_euryale.AAC.6
MVRCRERASVQASKTGSAALPSKALSRQGRSSQAWRCASYCAGMALRQAWHLHCARHGTDPALGTALGPALSIAHGH